MPPATPESQISIFAPQAGQTAVQVFANVAEAWRLTVDEQLALLGSPPRSTYFKWKKEGGALPKDTLERISHVYNIYRVLEILVPNAQQADKWMKAPNADFQNESALARAVRSFKDLVEVRQYLDAQRG